MVHSGSLSLGHQANATGQDQARSLWPRSLALPANGMVPIVLDERSTQARQRYLTALGNAANFALGNRFFLALMLRAGLAGTVGPLNSRLVHDAPHNLLWPGEDGVVVHRKGATPAGGAARHDIVTAWRRDLKQEAPWAYKDVGPIVETLRQADVAHPVAGLLPVLTVKG